MTETNPASQSYHLEKATWRDFWEFRRLERLSFGDLAWPAVELAAALVLPTITRIKAVSGGQLAGLIAGTERSDGFGWIMTIATFPEYQGRGIGSAMLHACEEQMNVPQMRLCVRAGNDSAIRLYLRHGYHHTEIWKNYYGRNIDALVMEKVRIQNVTDDPMQ